MGDDDWDQPRQGDLGDAHRPRPKTRVRAAGRGAPPPGAADETELMPGAGHFDGITFAEEADQATDVIAPRPHPGRNRRGRGRRIAAITGYTVLGLVSLLVLGITGYAWGTYDTFDVGVHKSDALIGPTERKSLNGDTNILIMGLDSRLDENGKPLPRNIYNALHAGDDSVGGYNANVLMLLHVPAHGQAVEISIPRDDYVNLPGCPDGVCKEKIKQAYGLARDEAYGKLRARGVRGADLEQRARDAGRKEEADTVSQFLGGIPIDHFIEVTLVAFFQIAQVVAPITVCVLKPTHDTFSGANFRAGRQRITAVQALAYVRQRRDNVRGDFYYHNFTDLDRERRQQAFISSLAYQLRQAGTFTSPSMISRILGVAKQNTAIDTGLNLLDFAQEASNLTGGHVTFNTLPVERFADLGGSIGDVNIVNVPVVQAEVKQWLGIKRPAAATTAPAAPPAATGVVDVVNRSGQSGAAGRLEKALSAKGFTQGQASTESLETSTVVEYGSSGAQAAARAVAGLLGGDATVQESSRATAGRVRVVLGTGFAMPTALGGTAAGTATPDAAALRNEAPGSNANAPRPLAGGSIPCVK
ncbi:MAG TPA: LCP family protein [Pseudonocardiaceae bacterium]|nr:LCP family protein [Pseudonocardiaceae bacterium]